MGALTKAGREVAGLAAGGLSATLSALRGGRRAFHSEGCCFEAVLEVDGGERLADGLLPVGRHNAVVRLSRGAGLPDRWPDGLGIAVKVQVGGDGDLDLLFLSSADGTVGKYLIVPARGFFERPYSTIGRYDCGGQHVLVGLLPPPGPGPTFAELRRSWDLDGVVFDVVVAPRGGGWRPAGRLVVGDPFPEGEALVFEPWKVPGPARPGGFLNSLRPWAYPASQQVQRDFKAHRR